MRLSSRPPIMPNVSRVRGAVTKTMSDTVSIVSKASGLPTQSIGTDHFTSPIDPVDACPKAFQKSGKRKAGSAKSKDAACALSHHARRTSLIELAARHHGLFHWKMLRGRKRHGQRVFRHRLGLRARIAREGHLWRQLIERNEVDASSKKLHKTRTSLIKSISSAWSSLIVLWASSTVADDNAARRAAGWSSSSRKMIRARSEIVSTTASLYAELSLHVTTSVGCFVRNHCAFSEGLLNARAILPSGRAQVRDHCSSSHWRLSLRLSTERNTTARQHCQRTRTRPAVTDKRC